MSEAEIEVAVVAWRYTTRERAEAERDRAKRQFKGRPFSVYGAKSETIDEGWVVFVGPIKQLDLAEAEWVPQGGEKAVMRVDLTQAMARRHLRDAFGIVLGDGGDYLPLP